MSDFQSRWGAALLDTYPAPPVELVSGSGATVTDADGNTYIDMLAGIAVNALGYAHPAVVEAVTQQVSTLGHVSNLFGSRPVIEAAEGLCARVGDDTARVFFCNSGAEANEAAFKLARLTGRRRILAAERGFHGRTMGALAMTGQPDKRAPFEPMPAGVEFYPYGDIDALMALVAQDPAGTAAIILEPIQGETGVVPAPAAFLPAVRQLCDAHGILLIVDEVQTGVGRTGDFFAFEHEGVLPDVITMAKGLGGGNPVACAAAGAVLRTVDDGFLAEVRRKGQLLRDEASRIPGVKDVRGRGLMLGVVLDAEVAKLVVTHGLERGVILNAPSDTVIRLTPPLVINDEEIRQAAERLAGAIADATERS